MLSQSAEYALRAVLFLAGPAAGRVASLDELADPLGISRSYLSKVLQQLVRAGVVESTRGRNGGFRLAVAPEQLRLIRVIAPFEDGAERRGCLLGRSVCSDGTPCAIHHAWRATAERIMQFFRTTSVADVRGDSGILLSGIQPV